MIRPVWMSAVLVGLMAWAGPVFGQANLIPQLDSRPGAAYTLYLNFAGFNYTGQWGNTGRTPGVVPAYTTDASANFSATEITNMRSIWSRTAEKYASFNINVTTVLPAAAGTTDAQRQLYFETTARSMQTIIGGSNAWYSAGAGGVSYVGVASGTGDPSANGNVGAGYKTNWAFPPNLSGGAPKSVAEAVAHEDGHALGLLHQARWNNGVRQGAYDDGTNTGFAIAPIMGVGYSTTRSTWRVGATDSNSSVTAQNDVLIIQANSGIRATTTSGFVNDGIGQTRATATALALTGNSINSNTAKGIISP
ncbi:MAG: hypothetical protein ACRCZF_17595, partial [Gemmataceae bacterium]